MSMNLIIGNAERQSLNDDQKNQYIKMPKTEMANGYQLIPRELEGKPVWRLKNWELKRDSEGTYVYQENSIPLSSIKELAAQELKEKGKISYPDTLQQSVAYAWNEIFNKGSGKWPKNKIPCYADGREVFAGLGEGKNLVEEKVNGNLVKYPKNLADTVRRACLRENIECVKKVPFGSMKRRLPNRFCATVWLDTFLQICSEYEGKRTPKMEDTLLINVRYKGETKKYTVETLYSEEEKMQQKKIYNSATGEDEIVFAPLGPKETDLEDCETETEPTVMEDVMDGKYATQEYNELEEEVNGTVESDSIEEMRRQNEELSRRMAKLEKEATVGGLFRKAIRATQNMVAKPFRVIAETIESNEE